MPSPPTGIQNTSSDKSKKYWAFISYSSKDAKWGQWLHRRIEAYPIPEEFRGIELFDGAVLGKNLKPCFRDRDELSGSSELGPAIAKALQHTRYLIVLCSPNSAKSEWVNKEIEDFKQLGGDQRILALILDGEPNSGGDTECFPPALRYPAEPLAGDLRKEGDGKERGFLKVIAGISQIGFDELYRRHERAQRKRRIALTSLSFLIIAALTTLSLLAINQRNLANDNAHKEHLARQDAEQQKEIAVESENKAMRSLAESDYRMAARHLNLGDPRKGFAYLQRSLKNNPDDFNAAQLLWTSICRENIRFAHKFRPLKVHNGFFNPRTKQVFWIDQTGDLRGSSTKEWKDQKITSLSPQKNEWVNSLGAFEKFSLQNDDLIYQRFEWGKKITSTVKLTTGAIQNNETDTIIYSNTGRFLNGDPNSLTPNQCREIFSKAKSVEDLILDYSTANDEEVMLVPDSEGQLLSVSGRPVISMSFLKKAQTIIAIREGGHSETRLIEAITLGGPKSRHLLAKGSRGMKINVAITPDQKFLVLQSGEEVNFMRVQTLLDFPTHLGDLDATSSVIRFPKTSTSLAKLVVEGEVRAASFGDDGMLHLLTTSGLMEFAIPDREERQQPLHQEHRKLVEIDTNDFSDGKPGADSFKNAQIAPLLVENRLESENPRYSLHRLSNRRGAGVLEIRRNVFDFPFSRLVTISLEKDLLLDQGFSGEYVVCTKNGNLAAAINPLQNYVFWEEQPKLPSQEYIFWCPIPAENTNPPWLADFAWKYSGVKINDEEQLVEERSQLLEITRAKWLSQSWQELTSRLNYQPTSN